MDSSLEVGEVLSVLMTRGGVLGGAMVISSVVGYAIVVVVALRLKNLAFAMPCVVNLQNTLRVEKIEHIYSFIC